MSQKNRIRSIKEKKKWKQLPITIGPNSLNNFDLIQFEELDDYELQGVDVDHGFNQEDEDIQAAIERSNKRRGIRVSGSGAASSKTDEENKPGNDKKKKKKKQPHKKNKKNNKRNNTKDKTSEEKNKESKKEDLDEMAETEKVEKDELSEKEDGDKKDQLQKEEETKIADGSEEKEEDELNLSIEMEVDSTIQELSDCDDEDKAKPNNNKALMKEGSGGSKRKTDDDSSKKSAAKKAKIGDEEVKETVDDVTVYEEMSAWNPYQLPLAILRALHDMGFTKPMPIQEQVLPVAIQQRRDVLGAAETGSGKTLAFGIPLVYHLMEDKNRHRIATKEEIQARRKKKMLAAAFGGKENDDDEEVNFDDYVDEDFDEEDEDEFMLREDDDSYLPALVLTPTRELAMQVKTHLSRLVRYTDVTVAVVVGGMSVQKQRRVLGKRPDVVIATPGRLWELANTTEDDHLSRLELLRYVVVDEADRMLEKGHFDDLRKIFQQINGPRTGRNEGQKKRMNLMFSATLTCVREVSARVKHQPGYKAETKSKKLEELSRKLMSSRKPHVVDLTTKKITAENLREMKIFCEKDEKDYYLYYFLKANPGRTLVFVNSIDSIFRLNGVFDSLKLQPLHLHAKMQQRQRLKHLERFQKSPNSVLFASDVAARGLDITDVNYVIHYQVPRTLETFVHRSGRCARSGKEGLSVVFVSPQESRNYRKLLRSADKTDLDAYQVDGGVMSAVKKRVKLAREVDTMTHRIKKVRVRNDWFSKMATEADLIVDDDLIVKDENSEEKEHLLKMKRQQLDKVLKKPIFPHGFSGNYITKTGKLEKPNYQFAH